MDKTSAARAFSALAQETRLDVFRMLVRAGSDGMAAGDIARAAGVPHNTMSAHLSVLANAGLVGARRAGRSVIYAIDFEGVRGLLAFLMEDCCQGRPELCAPAIETLMPACCVP